MDFKSFNFFDFAGSIVGGSIFMTITTLFIALTGELYYPELLRFLVKVLDMKALSNWWFFVMLSMSLAVGYFISTLSVFIFYPFALKCARYKDFREELEKYRNLEMKIPKNDEINKPTYLGQIKMAISFANNSGHPHNLYQFAGRARLFGSGALNIAWILILSCLFIFIPCIYDPSPGFGKLDKYLQAAYIIIGLSFIGLIFWSCFTVTCWISYLKRVELYSVYQYKNGEIVKSSSLLDIAKGKHKESN